MSGGLATLVAMVLAIVAVVVAVVLPLAIERIKRPRFSLSAASPTRVENVWYIHVRIINQPVRGLLGKWLLRHTATGCHASLTYEATTIKHEPASWPARPDAWMGVLRADESLGEIYDPTKLEQRFRMDLEPSREGEVIIAAIKHDGEVEAYALSKASYIEAWRNGLRAPRLELAAGEYRLTVGVAAGGVEAKGEFIVRNGGSACTDLSIESNPQHQLHGETALPALVRRLMPPKLRSSRMFH